MVPKYDHYLEYKQLNTQLDPSSSVWKTICHLLEQSYHRNYCQTLFVVRKRLLPIHKLRSHMPTKVTVTSMSEEVTHYESTTEKYCNGLKVKTLKWLVAILLKIMTMEHPRSLNSAPFYCTVCSIWKRSEKNGCSSKRMMVLMKWGQICTVLVLHPFHSDFFQMKHPVVCTYWVWYGFFLWKSMDRKDRSKVHYFLQL